MRLIACALLALALAGCSNYERFQGPQAYQESDSVGARTGSWARTCHKPERKGDPRPEICRLEMQQVQEGGYLTVYAAYSNDELVLGFITPPNTTGKLDMSEDSRNLGSLPYLGCNKTECRAVWMLSRTEQNDLLAARQLKVSYRIRNGADSEFNLRTLELNRALASLR